MITYSEEYFKLQDKESVRIAYCTHDPSFLPEIHSHDFYELVVVREGEALHNMNGEDIPIHSGDVFLIPPGKNHTYHSLEFLGIFNIMFQKNVIAYFDYILADSVNYQILFQIQPHLPQKIRMKAGILNLSGNAFAEALDHLEKGMKSWKKGTSESRLECLGRFLILISQIIRKAHFSTETDTGTYINRISELAAELSSRYAGDWSLESMSDFSGMSQSNFRVQFKKIFGTSPVNYLLQFRLKKASELLKLRSMNISEVAFRAGFQDSNYFSKQFRVFFGMSPREFKKRFMQ